MRQPVYGRRRARGTSTRRGSAALRTRATADRSGAAGGHELPGHGLLVGVALVHQADDGGDVLGVAGLVGRLDGAATAPRSPGRSRPGRRPGTGCSSGRRCRPAGRPGAPWRRAAPSSIWRAVCSMASRSSCIHASSLPLRTAAVLSTASAISSWTWTTGSVTAGATLLLSSTQIASMSCWVVGPGDHVAPPVLAAWRFSAR